MRKTFSGLTLRPHQKESSLVKLCEKKLHAPCRYFKILKKSLDARDKADIRWVYTVECGTEAFTPPPRVFEQVKTAPRVVIVGAGPAGLFCALRLLDHGVRPVVLERGKRVEERAEDVRRFSETGVLDPSSNIQFGEGGAGAFSDGKLNTQTNSPLNRDVLETFVRFGAPQEVGYLGKPHVGSDNLKKVVANMREYILSQGGEFRFSTALTDLKIQDGKLRSFTAGGQEEECDALVLAVGHSARDTFETLLSRGFCMEQKEFAVGVRIEHLQSAISRAQYGAARFRRAQHSYGQMLVRGICIKKPRVIGNIYKKARTGFDLRLPQARKNGFITNSLSKWDLIDLQQRLLPLSSGKSAQLPQHFHIWQ